MGTLISPHFGAIHSRRQNEISATVPTPPSQSADEPQQTLCQRALVWLDLGQ